MIVLLYLLLVAVQSVSSSVFETSDIQATATNFFSLFTMNCETWSSVFQPNGVFFHPQFPTPPMGIPALTQFCTNIQQSFDLSRSLFRQDGDILLTSAGGADHLLIPYVFSTILNDTTNGVFVNTGYESIVLTAASSSSSSSSSPRPKILRVTELFDRSEIPFNWTSEFVAAGSPSFVGNTTISVPVLQSNLLNLFKLFNINCSAWVNSFEVSASFYHPVATNVIGRDALEKFCVSSQSSYPSSETKFRQNGPFLWVWSGGLVHVLSPYVFSTMMSNPRQVFDNTGFEFFVINVNNNNNATDTLLSFANVTEFFNRNRISYWNPSTTPCPNTTKDRTLQILLGAESCALLIFIGVTVVLARRSSSYGRRPLASQDSL